jgi:hypothetical protein
MNSTCSVRKHALVHTRPILFSLFLSSDLASIWNGSACFLNCCLDSDCDNNFRLIYFIPSGRRSLYAVPMPLSQIAFETEVRSEQW